VNEASLTQDLHKAIKPLLLGWDVYKVCDRVTKGRPDTLITGHGFTSFIEVKHLKPGDSLVACTRGKNALQCHTMKHLWEQSGHRAWYVVFDCRKRGQRDLLIYTPEAMEEGRTPLMWEETDGKLCEELTAAGAVGFRGFAHGTVALLLKETHVQEEL
jgi:hypothetical protein